MKLCLKNHRECQRYDEYSGKEMLEDKLNEVYWRAFEHEKEKGGCSRCVLAALKEVFEIVNEDIFRAGDALSAGGAITGQGTCGALSGGMMAISYQLGRGYKDFVKGSSKNW